MTCVLAAGCAGGSESVGSADQAATGACRVMFEDEDMVLFRTPEGERLIASKRLHVVDVRMTPSQRTASALEGTRFWDSHVEYVLAPRVTEESLMKIGNMLGEQFPAAPITINTSTGAVDTTMRPASTRFSAEGENVVADLVDPTDGASPVMNAAYRRSFLRSARVNATAACGGGQIPITLETGAGAPTFEATKAKLFQAGNDLRALDQFLATANAIKSGDRYRDNLTKVGPEVASKMTAFAELVDREIRPFANVYGASAGRAELQGKVNAAWASYLDLAGTVLRATNSTVGVEALFVRNGDGSYGMNEETPALANELLPGANTFRFTVEGALAERGDLWAERALQP
ncbi:MAG: hypothetical protein KIT84_41300 [Labilithrix sp.]|nr:hypothetical protein [Labilithrix sp.]MCW5817508.1 hypothetical protein [Labilithrix sp.]